MNQVTPIPQGSALLDPKTKGEVFKSINSSIPLNNFHLPDYIYRADLIGTDLLQLTQKDRALILDSASIPISFEHGYPAIYETQPFWEQLPCEDADAYSSFIQFLELPAKTLSENPIRLLPMIATVTGNSLEDVTEWCHIYYWHWRARAYDLFLIACHRKQREQRIMTIEGNHFRQADILLDKITTIATIKLDRELRDLKDDEEAETETKLRDLISMAKDLMGIQRVSLGLPSAGPAAADVKDTQPRHSTVTDTFRYIANEGAGEQATSSRTVEVDQLLASPDDLSTIQELMVRLQRPNHTLPAWGEGTTINPDSPDSNTGSDSDADIVEDLGNPV